jgi:hypothetical protein
VITREYHTNSKATKEKAKNPVAAFTLLQYARIPINAH